MAEPIKGDNGELLTELQKDVEQTNYFLRRATGVFAAVVIGIVSYSACAFIYIGKMSAQIESQQRELERVNKTIEDYARAVSRLAVLHDGVFLKIERGELFVSGSAGFVRTFYMDLNPKVTIAGKAATTTDLREGWRIEFLTNESGKVIVIRTEGK